MKYLSTRGLEKDLSFKDVLFAGKQNDDENLKNYYLNITIFYILNINIKYVMDIMIGCLIKC